MGGRIQNEDIKTESEITGSGGTSDQLPNASKIWIATLGKTLEQAIIDGDIGVSSAPIGSFVGRSSGNTPTGYLPCDGAAVSRTTYADLFSEIGETHGEGDNSTTFNVPDYRGRVLRGVDGAAGRDPDSASRTAMNTGGNTGNLVGSVQSDQYLSHTHNFTTNDAPPLSFSLGSQPPRTQNTGGATAVTQASGGNETRMKNANVHWFIKY